MLNDAGFQGKGDSFRDGIDMQLFVYLANVGINRKIADFHPGCNHFVAKAIGKQLKNCLFPVREVIRIGGLGNGLKKTHDPQGYGWCHDSASVVHILDSLQDLVG